MECRAAPETFAKRLRWGREVGGRQPFKRVLRRWKLKLGGKVVRAPLRESFDIPEDDHPLVLSLSKQLFDEGHDDVLGTCLVATLDDRSSWNQLLGSLGTIFVDKLKRPGAVEYTLD